MQTISVASIAPTGVPSLRARKSTASLRATSVKRTPAACKLNKDVLGLAAASASMMAAFPALASVENIVATQAAAGGDDGSLSTLLPWLFAAGGIFAAYNVTPPSAQAAAVAVPQVAAPPMPMPPPVFQAPQPIYIPQPAAAAPAVSPIPKDEVERTQRAWGDGLVGIGLAKQQGGDFVALAEKQVDELYAFQYVPVLFKPTKAKVVPFRSTRESALSYFVGGNSKYTEDTGFALQPWVSVVFENDTVIVRDDMTLAMGHYTFTDPKGTQAKVEYTFGFVRDPTGKARICLQHSSLPFSG